MLLSPFERSRVLLIGSGAGVEPIVELAKRPLDEDRQLLVLLSLEVPPQFRPRPSTILVPGMPEGTIACHPDLDAIGIASRLANGDGYPGCFEGEVTELASIWLESLDASARGEVQMIACGPDAIVNAAAAVADRSGVPLATLS